MVVDFLKGFFRDFSGICSKTKGRAIYKIGKNCAFLPKLYFLKHGGFFRDFSENL
jgi:hypothetical protein